MFVKFALTIFAGGVLAFFSLPDQEAGFRVFVFSTAFLILVFAAGRIIESFGHKNERYRTPQMSSRYETDLSSRDAPKADWSTSGVDPRDPNLTWQYRLNDQRLGRLRG